MEKSTEEIKALIKVLKEELGEFSTKELLPHILRITIELRR